MDAEATKCDDSSEDSECSLRDPTTVFCDSHDVQSLYRNPHLCSCAEFPFLATIKP